MQNSTETLQIDKRQFLIEKVLKQTVPSRVCIVRDTEHHERYVYRRFSGTGEVYRRMLGINCPHLPKIYAVEEDNGQVQVLEEYVQGDTLAFLMTGKPLPEESAKNILLQLCNALNVFHDIGAVHRDIKPENILIRGETVVLIDFHASRISNPVNASDTRILGTTGYAAPEQYGFSQTDARADIYALGVLLNEMLTLEHPSRRLAEGSLRPVIERCIEVNVDKRFSDVSELENAILSGSPQKKRWWIPMLVGLAVLVCLSLFFSGKRTSEVSVPENTETTTTATIEEVSEPATKMEVIQPTPQAISDEVWAGINATYETHFQYDLDGDGQMESYAFGLFHMDIPEMHQNTLSDTFMLGSSDTNQRRVYPCVWLDTSNGTPERSEELTALLSDASITLWRAEGNTAPAPVVFQLPSGGIHASFDYQNMGTWIYEVHATLNGQELTALGQSHVLPKESSN